MILHNRYRRSNRNINLDLRIASKKYSASMNQKISYTNENAYGYAYRSVSTVWEWFNKGIIFRGWFK